MKRINSKTNAHFVRGDTREDGYVFYKYTNILRKDGTFKEIWLSPEAFATRKAAAKAKRMKDYTRTSTRLPKGWTSKLWEKKLVNLCRQLWERMYAEPMTKAELYENCWSDKVYNLLEPHTTDYGN